MRKKATKPEFVVEGRDEGGRQIGKQASDAWVAQPAPPPEGNLLVVELKGACLDTFGRG